MLQRPGLYQITHLPYMQVNDIRGRQE